MFHLHPGMNGLITGIAVFLVLWLLVFYTRGAGPFNLDPNGVQNAFEPFLAKYLRIGEFVVGLASGSIVLLLRPALRVGANNAAHKRFYASPLFLLGWCVLYGILFMVWLTYHYEDYQHGTQHTRPAYTLSLTLGFSSLVCLGARIFLAYFHAEFGVQR